MDPRGRPSRYQWADGVVGILSTALMMRAMLTAAKYESDTLAADDVGFHWDRDYELEGGAEGNPLGGRCRGRPIGREVPRATH